MVRDDGRAGRMHSMMRPIATLLVTTAAVIMLVGG